MVDIVSDAGPHGQRVAVRGVLDVRAVPDVRLAMHALIDGHRGPVLLDLQGCHLRDSTAFGLLIETFRRARRAGRPVRIVAADDRTCRLLRRARLGAMLPVPAREESGTALAVAT